MAIDTVLHPDRSQLWLTRNQWLRLLGILLIACHVMACTIGDDDDDDTSVSNSTTIRLDVALPSGTTPAQIGDLLLEVWFNDPDDSLLGNAEKDSDQIDTALLLLERTVVREVVPGGNVGERLIFELDFVNSVSAANNLVLSVLLFPDSQSTSPTFVARAGTIGLPGSLGSTVMMTLGAAEIVQFDNATVGEEAGTAVFTGTLAPSSPRAVVLNIATQDGMSAQSEPAVVDEDYEAITGALIFGSGETAQNITIPIINDGQPEATETFNVLIQLDIQFSNNNRAFIAGGLNGGTFHQLIGTITDNDLLPAIPNTGVRFDIALPDELNAAQADALFVEVWIHDLDDSLLNNSRDRDQVDFSLLIQDRVVVQNLSQDSVADRLVLDIDLMDTVSMANNTAVSVLLFPDATSTTPTFVARTRSFALPTNLASVVTMTLGTAEFVQLMDITVAEGAGNAVFTATLAPTSSQAVGLNYATQNGTPAQGNPAIAGQDYTATNSIARIEPGQASTDLIVPILNDTNPEGPEIFNVLTELDLRFADANRAFITGGLNGGTFRQVMGTITDND